MRRTYPEGIRQLAANFANSIVDPISITDAALGTAVQLAKLNAFVRLTPEHAMHQANESSFRYKERCQKSMLDGVPIAIKDNFCTKDIETTCASKMLQGFVPTYNATVCDRLINAGATIIGKTNMDQFAMGAGTVDSIFGPTKNVWSKDIDGEDWNIAGGSSGGSATAVAAGICFAAIGSDTGGSTRNPAAYCGIVGLKPTYGLVSRYGLIPLVNSMDVPGILTRSVDDCVAVLNVISGPDDRDATTLKDVGPKVQLPFVDELTVKNVRIGIPKEYHCPGLSPEVLESWMKVADILEDNGAIVKQVSLPNTLNSIYVYSILNQCEVASNMARYDGIEFGHRANVGTSTEELYAKTRAEGFSTVVKTRILTGNYFLLRNNYEKYFLQALKVRRLIAKDFQNVFDCDKIDVLLTPTTLTDAPLYKDFTQSSNRDQCAVQDIFTQPANMAGIPAISIPIRLSSNGLPISLQLMSNTLTENLLLRVAKWIETRLDFQEVEPPRCMGKIPKASATLVKN